MNNPIRPSLKTEILPIVFIIFSFLAAFYFFAHFPERVPIHWNFAGVADGWGSAKTAAFAIPILMVFMYLLFLFLPFLDPRKERYAEFSRAYHIFKAVIIFFLGFIYVLASLNGLSYNVPIGFYVPLMIGVLFMVMGNYMGKFKSNWFIGMRNPWTLSDEEVWNKTNRLTGKIFMISGVALIVSAFLPAIYRPAILVLAAVSIIIIPTAYSFIIFKKKKTQ